ETHAIRHVFAMTGAVPNTRWLGGCVALDAQGFIKTGADLSPEDLAAARSPLARPPHLLETSLPGVFAVGDVRRGSIKRVASAVGEGSIAVAFVHQVLHELQEHLVTRPYVICHMSPSIDGRIVTLKWGLLRRLSAEYE